MESGSFFFGLGLVVVFELAGEGVLTVEVADAFGLVVVAVDNVVVVVLVAGAEAGVMAGVEVALAGVLTGVVGVGLGVGVEGLPVSGVATTLRTRAKKKMVCRVRFIGSSTFCLSWTTGREKHHEGSLLRWVCFQIVLAGAGEELTVLVGCFHIG